MIYTTKRFSLKGAALYGGGYIVGGLAGEAVGKKIGEHIKRELGPKDLKKTEAELKELRKFLEVHKNQRFSGLSIRKYEDNPEICRVINLNGVSNDNPDDYDFGMMNKNKAKIIKSIQEAIKAKEEILRDPKNHPGNYGDLGRKIGGTIGVGGGLLAAHKLKKFSSKTKEEDFRKELNDAYKKNNRGRNIGHAVLGGSLGMIAGALKKGGNPKSMLIGTAIGSGLGSLSEYGYRKATKQDKKYQKEVDKRVSDYHEKLKNVPEQPNWDDYKDNKKYTNAIKTREKKINEAEEVRNKALNDIKRNTSKNPGKYNILRKE